MFDIIRAWNTECRYTSAGQRIAAGITKDNEVYFVDIDREIGGKLNEYSYGSPILLNLDWVHKQYVNNEYVPILPDSDEWVALEQVAKQVRGLDDE